MNLEAEYLKRKEKFTKKALDLEQRYNRIAIFRLIFFLIGFGLTIFLFQKSTIYGLLSLFIFIVLAVRFVIWHNKLKHQQRHFNALSQINQNEILGLQNDFSAFDGGEEFIDAEHPYSYDLDFFGDHSFFQFCNRTVTYLGKENLAKKLSKTSSTEEIKLRQEAIKELAKKIDWRQNFQSIGLDIKDNPKHLDILSEWLQVPAFVINDKLLTFLRFVAPFFSLAALILAFSQPLYIVILLLLPALYTLRITLERINDTHLRTTHSEKALGRYASLIKHIEKENFDASLLQKLKANLSGKEQSSAKTIKQLSYIISQLNVRYNFFAIFLNLLTLWDLQWVARLEQWKDKNKDKLEGWFESLNEFDALISLSTLAHNKPDWIYPEVNNRKQLKGIGLGHPLIPTTDSISNDLVMPTSEHIKLVTGSNMAGKSTFLRTVGINIVLAQMGSKVCAKELTLPQLAVYTSMRTTDALHENTSSFYAELKRLKIILDAVDRKEQVYFLLDEILKGTNSKDRHTGSKALIEQLIKSGGAGIIATHDLELSSLEAQYDGNLENLCMEVEVNDDELVFDYKLKKGVSKSFNATTLMRNMGIKISKEL